VFNFRGSLQTVINYNLEFAFIAILFSPNVVCPELQRFLRRLDITSHIREMLKESGPTTPRAMGPFISALGEMNMNEDGK